MLHTVCNGRGHLYDDSSAPSLHGKNSENGAKEVKIKVFKPFKLILYTVVTTVWYHKSRALKDPNNLFEQRLLGYIWTLWTFQ